MIKFEIMYRLYGMHQSITSINYIIIDWYVTENKVEIKYVCISICYTVFECSSIGFWQFDFVFFGN